LEPALKTGIDRTAIGEWRAAWFVPFVSAIGYAATTTHIYSLGLFLEREFCWSRSEITFGLTITSSVVVLFGAFLGVLVDRVGPRRIAITGLFLYCALFSILSITGASIWNWRVLWLFLGLGALGVQPVVWSAAVAARFHRSRGVALSIALSGGALSAAITPLLATFFIETLGWRQAFLALGATLAVISLPLVVLFFSSGPAASPGAAETRSTPGPGYIFRSRQFASLVVISLIMTGAMMGTIVHFVPLLSEAGHSRPAAAATAGMIGLCSIAGRLIGGFLLDRLSGPIVASCIFILPVMGASLLFWAAGNAGTALLTAALFGLAVGGEVDVLAYMTSRYFGLRQFGSMFALVSVAGTVGLGVGPTLGGLIYDWAGSYDLLLLLVAAASILATLLASQLGPYPKTLD
jgi:predicted MFS family arabinose efflux permease